MAIKQRRKEIIPKIKQRRIIVITNVKGCKIGSQIML